MAVILNNDVGMLGLDALGQRTQEGWLSDASHVLQTNLLSTGCNHLVGNGTIILYGMHRTGGDAERGLWNHACRLGPLDTGYDVARVIQAAEDTWDIDTLCLFHLVHQLAHIVGHGIHAQGVQAAVQHVSLDAYFIEGLTERANSQVGVLASHEVHLFEGSAIGLYTAEATHVDDSGGNALQLVLTRLKLAARLPHVTIDKTKLDFLLHKL